MDIRIPKWINTEEDLACYKKIMDIAKKIGAFSLIAEEEGIRYFLLEIDAEKVSDEIFKMLYLFNDGTNPLMCDVVLGSQNVRGERYVIF